MGVDWLSHNYAGMLAMCDQWFAVLTAEVRIMLGMPAEVWDGFRVLVEAARGWYGKSQDEAAAQPAILGGLCRRSLRCKLRRDRRLNGARHPWREV